jgi:molecular chaperone GrpE (heat shock protein)
MNIDPIPDQATGRDSAVAPVDDVIVVEGVNVPENTEVLDPVSLAAPVPTPVAGEDSAGSAAIANQATLNRTDELLAELAALDKKMEAVLQRSSEILGRAGQISEAQKLAADQMRRFGGKVEQVATGAASAPLRQLAEGLVFYHDLVAAMATSSNPQSLGSASEVCQMLLGQLEQPMDANGIDRLDADGEPDYQRHRAVETVPAMTPDQVDKIVSVRRAGFRLGDRVLRPAEVVVAVARPPQKEE